MISIHKQIQIAIRYSDVEGARRLAREALAKQPDAELYYLASLVAEDAEERRECLENALSLNPEHIEAHSELSKMKRKREHLKARPMNKRRVLFMLLTLFLLLGLLAFYVRENYSPAVLPAQFAGEWVGTSYSEEIGTLRHELNIGQEGMQIVGTSSGENLNGHADAYIRGTYENGYLVYETYGGTRIGWNGICHFRVTVEYKELDGQAHLIGSYETLPENEEWECSYYGTIDLQRLD
jgi:hypothetical protein